MSASSNVIATLDYLSNDTFESKHVPLVYYTEERERSTMRTQPIQVMIEDGRDSVDKYDLESHGFCLTSHVTHVESFSDQQKIEKLYSHEIERLLASVTGARKVIALGVNTRFAVRPHDFKKTGDDQPARFPHADFTNESSEALIAMLKEQCPDYRRAAIYNVWRVLSRPPQDFPLAVCDARTISPGDEVIAEARIDLESSPVSAAMTTVYKHNEAHRWVYFRDMTINEVLIFKGYDSLLDKPQRVPHSSFFNNVAVQESRRSIEVRAVAFF